MTADPNILDTVISNLPPPDELDELMSRDPLDMSTTDIDKIIAYNRQMRAKKETGGYSRAKKAGADTPKLSLDLAALGFKPAAPVIGAVKRRM